MVCGRKVLSQLLRYHPKSFLGKIIRIDFQYVRAVTGGLSRAVIGAREKHFLPDVHRKQVSTTGS